MTVEEIKSVINYNLLRAEKKATANGYTGYYEHVYELLTHTQNSLLANGKRWTREWLESLHVLSELEEFKERLWKLFL